MPSPETPPIAAGRAPEGPRRRSPWSAYRVALIVIVGVAAAVLAHVKITHDKALRDAETLVSALAVASEQHIGGSLDAANSLLDEVAATVREGRHRDPHFVEDLSARLPSYPEIRGIGIAAADGTVLPDSWPPRPAGAGDGSVSDRRFFTAQRDASGSGRLVVGEPVVVDGQRRLHLSRPVRDRAGRFGGVVVATIDPDAYAAFLSSVLYDEAGAGALLTVDGRMVARAPNHAAEFGRDVSSSDLIRLWVPRQPRGVARLVAPTDNNDKLVAYRVMPEFGLVVTAGISRAKALAGWRPMAAAELALLVLFSGLLVYWTGHIRRQDAQLGEEQHNLEAAVSQRSLDLKQARRLAEDRAVQLERINAELKRLTLVAAHHLQEPLRTVVSCSQMVARSFARPAAELEQAVETVCRDGLVLKERLGDFERRIGDLTRVVADSEAEETPPLPPPGAPARPRTYSARAVALAIIAALLGGNALQLRIDYQDAISAAENLTGAVVKSAAHHLQASVRRIDAMLYDVELAAEDGRIATPAFGERLLARLETMPEIRMVYRTDAGGRVSSPTWPDYPLPPQGASVAEREFFREQAGAPSRGRLVVGRPQPGLVDGERSIQFSHPILHTDGSFAGLVVASVDPDLYARFLETLLLDEDGGTAVLTLEGRMVARAPRHEEKFGIDISRSDLFTRYLPQAREGIAHLVSKADGNEKLLGYRVLGDYPLLVTSGYSIASALAEWKQVAALSSVLAVAASMVLFAWAHRADRHSRHLALYRARLAAEIEMRTAGLAAAHRAAEMRTRQLAVANDRLHELVRLMATELNGPLDGMAAHIATLHQLASGGSDEADHWLAFITAASIHLQALMRDYPRFVAALCQAAVPQPLECGAVVHSAIAHVRDAWNEDQVVFQVGALPRLLADPDLLRQVFVHLFTNAAVHARDRLPVTVQVSACPQEIGWRITVADDGPGLPPVNSDLLFRAFETAHDRKPDSTGLGLPLCRVIVQHHGGRIWATSRPGKGCDIHFTLPGAADSGAEAAS